MRSLQPLIRVVLRDSVVRDFTKIADTMILHNRRVHFAVIAITAFMVPGFLSSLTPIDIEAYNMDSPELEANDVMREEFSGAGNIWGFGIFVRDTEHTGDNPSEISMIQPFPGVSFGLENPKGGVLNLSILRDCLLYTSPSPRDVEESRMPSSA